MLDLLIEYGKFIAEKDDITWRRGVFSFYLRMSIVLMVVVILPLLLLVDIHQLLTELEEKIQNLFLLLGFYSCK